MFLFLKNNPDTQQKNTLERTTNPIFFSCINDKRRRLRLMYLLDRSPAGRSGGHLKLIAPALVGLRVGDHGRNAQRHILGECVTRNKHTYHRNIETKKTKFASVQFNLLCHIIYMYRRSFRYFSPTSIICFLHEHTHTPRGCRWTSGNLLLKASVVFRVRQH